MDEGSQKVRRRRSDFSCEHRQMKQRRNLPLQREPAKMSAGMGGLWHQGEQENGVSMDG
jgi:hypothetical protein